MPIDFIPLNGCKVRAAPDNKKSFCFILEAPEMDNKTFLIQSNTKVSAARLSSFIVLTDGITGGHGRLDCQDQGSVLE